MIGYAINDDLEFLSKYDYIDEKYMNYINIETSDFNETGFRN